MGKRVSLVRPAEAARVVKLLGEGAGVMAVAEEMRLDPGLVSAVAVVTGAGLDRVRLRAAQVAQRRAVARLLGERVASPDCELAVETGLGRSSLANLALAWRLTRALRKRYSPT